MWFALASILLSVSLGDLPLQTGGTLPDCRITYRAYGQLNAEKSNVILIPTWYNGRSEDLARFMGPGRLVDDNDYYVIVVDALGNGSSSSPSNAMHLCVVMASNTIRDMVESQHQLLTRHLGIQRVHAIIGISMGGMQVYEWMAAYPNFMNKAVPIVATPEMSEKDIKLWTSHFKIFNRAGGGVDVGSDEMGEEVPKEPEAKQTIVEQVMGMARQGMGMYRRFRDPFNPLKQFEAIRSHSIGRPFNNSLAEASKRVRVPFLTIIASSDTAVSPDTPRSFSDGLGMPVIELDSKCGHAAFKCEHYEIGAAIAKFLAE
ncbi:MAG: alpha/beta fold hydrolase [Bryobacterales bacterium]|nr:alpha/beta fold hydrolase [Bryobacterales bacterium]